MVCTNKSTGTIRKLEVGGRCMLKKKRKESIYTRHVVLMSFVDYIDSTRCKFFLINSTA
jgi:hypothetical protein